MQSHFPDRRKVTAAFFRGAFRIFGHVIAILKDAWLWNPAAIKLVNDAHPLIGQQLLADEGRMNAVPDPPPLAPLLLRSQVSTALAS
jgi:hypothetical protein